MTAPEIRLADQAAGSGRRSEAMKRPWWRRNRIVAPVALFLGIAIGSAGGAAEPTKTSTTRGAATAGEPAATRTATADTESPATPAAGKATPKAKPP